MSAPEDNDELEALQEQLNRSEARINELEQAIPRYTSRIHRLEQDIAARQERIERLTDRIQLYERRSRDPMYSLTTRERFREAVANMEASRGVYRSWQTRKSSDLADQRRLKGASEYWHAYHTGKKADFSTKIWASRLGVISPAEITTSEERESALATLSQAETEVEALIDELQPVREKAADRDWGFPGEYDKLTDFYQAIYGRIGYLTRTINELREKLTVKQPIKLEISLFVIVDSRVEGRYVKRMQVRFTVDALRDPITGEFDYSHPLTQAELRQAHIEFLKAWNWDQNYPDTARTPEPQRTEEGVYEEIDLPDGAHVESIDMRDRYNPRNDFHIEGSQSDRVTPDFYHPSDDEVRDFLEYAGYSDEQINRLTGGGEGEERE